MFTQCQLLRIPQAALLPLPADSPWLLRTTTLYSVAPATPVQLSRTRLPDSSTTRRSDTAPSGASMPVRGNVRHSWSGTAWTARHPYSSWAVTRQLGGSHGQGNPQAEQCPVGHPSMPKAWNGGGQLRGPTAALTCLKGGDRGGHLPTIVECVEGDAVLGAWLQPRQLVSIGAAGERHRSGGLWSCRKGRITASCWHGGPTGATGTPCPPVALFHSRR